MSSLSCLHFLLFLAITVSCGKRSSFSADSTISKKSPNAAVLEGDMTSKKSASEDAQSKQLKVEEACSGEKEVITKTVRFPGRQGCSFGENGNLAEKNLHFQAQFLENQSFEIPEKGAVCDLSLKSAEGRIRYDDYFVLTLEDYILVATHPAFVVDELAENAGKDLFKWEFDRVKGHTWTGYSDSHYCLGKNSTCVVPKTDRVGQIEVEIAGSELVSLAAEILDLSRLNVGLATIGDNDNSDCSHTDLEFELKISLGKKK